MGHKRLPVATLTLVLQEICPLEELLLVELELPHLSIETSRVSPPAQRNKFPRNKRSFWKRNKTSKARVIYQRKKIKPKWRCRRKCRRTSRGERGTSRLENRVGEGLPVSFRRRRGRLRGGANVAAVGGLVGVGRWSKDPVL